MSVEIDSLKNEVQVLRSALASKAQALQIVQRELGTLRSARTERDQAVIQLELLTDRYRKLKRQLLASASDRNSNSEQSDESSTCSSFVGLSFELESPTRKPDSKNNRQSSDTPAIFEIQDLRLKLEDARETVEMLREQLRRERERNAQAQAQHRLSAHSQSSDASAAAPPNSGLAAMQHSGSGSDTESRVGAAGSNGLPSRGSAECSKCPNRSDHCIYKKERDSLVVELEAARSQCQQLQSELMALAEEKQHLLSESEAYRGKWERLNREILERAQSSLKAAGESGSKSAAAPSSSPSVGASSSAEQLQSLVSGFSLDLDAVFAENRSLRQRVEELARGGPHTPTQPSLGGALQHTVSRYLSWRARADSKSDSFDAKAAGATCNAAAPVSAPASASPASTSTAPASASASANLRSAAKSTSTSAARKSQPTESAPVQFARSLAQQNPSASGSSRSLGELAEPCTPPQSSPSHGASSHTAVGPNMQTNMLGVGLLPFTLKRVRYLLNSENLPVMITSGRVEQPLTELQKLASNAIELAQDSRIAAANQRKLNKLLARRIVELEQRVGGAEHVASTAAGEWSVSSLESSPEHVAAALTLHPSVSSDTAAAPDEGALERDSSTGESPPSQHPASRAGASGLERRAPDADGDSASLQMSPLHAFTVHSAATSPPAHQLSSEHLQHSSERPGAPLTLPQEQSSVSPPT